ncbi:uncharacterized protein [Haliotis asinina]|uniref:uncharacterized protein n=1 Tax=Haliotis asinina TaxID=109174 RepID=UPI0035326AC0
MVIDYPALSGQTDCNPPTCHKVTITASNFSSVDNNDYTTTGEAAWVTDGVKSGQCASVSSIYPAWEAEFGQDRTVSSIKIFWQDAQDDVYVSVGGRICHSAASTGSTYTWRSEYTLACGVPVRGSSLRIYRQPTVGLLNLSLCEVEIYVTSESSSTSLVSATTQGPTATSTAATTSPHWDATSDTHSAFMDSAAATIASTPTTVSSSDIFTNHANPRTTISPTTTSSTLTTPPSSSTLTTPPSSSKLTTLPSTSTTTSTSSTPTIPSFTATTNSSKPKTSSSTTTTNSSTPTTPSSSDTSPASMNVLDTTTTASFLETNTPVISNYETGQTEATTFPIFTTSEELLDSTTNHFLTPSSTVPPDTSNQTNTLTYFTWPTSSLLSSQGSSSVFRSTSVNLSFHSTTAREVSTSYNTFRNESMIPSTYKPTTTTPLTVVSAATTASNTAPETYVPTALTRSVISGPASTTIASTTTLTSNDGTLTTTEKPDAAETTPNVGQDSITTKTAKTSNMSVVLIVAVVGGCVMLLYIVGIAVFVWRQHRRAWYSPGRAK